MQETEIRWMKEIKGWLKLMALAVSMAAILIAIFLSSNTSNRLHKEVDVYYDQALRASTLTDFANVLRQYDQALEKEGMVKGNTSISGKPWTTMEFFRASLTDLANQADGLAKVNAKGDGGLRPLQTMLRQSKVSSVNFWMLRQGGLKSVFLVPLILAGVALSLVIISALLPEVRRKVTGATPTMG